MRIGILTLPLHTNDGGILQAYALQTVLERMGHEVTLIDKGWPPNVSFLGYIKRIVKESIKKVMPINLLFLLLFIQGIYLGIRCYLNTLYWTNR